MFGADEGNTWGNMWGLMLGASVGAVAGKLLGERQELGMLVGAAAGLWWARQDAQRLQGSAQGPVVVGYTWSGSAWERA